MWRVDILWVVQSDVIPALVICQYDDEVWLLARWQCW
jgi:hypothetical protein